MTNSCGITSYSNSTARIDVNILAGSACDVSAMKCEVKTAAINLVLGDCKLGFVVVLGAACSFLLPGLCLSVSAHNLLHLNKQ